MKKSFKIRPRVYKLSVIVAAIVCVSLFIICFLRFNEVYGSKDPINVHVHTFSDEWMSDDEYHWHAATCEHKEEAADKAAHDYIEDPGVYSRYVCSVCKREKNFGYH